MHSTDAGAGEHADGRLGNHRHVDRDTITFLYANRLQNIGKSADALMQFGVADSEIDVGIVAFPDNGGLVGFIRQVTVHAVVTDVELAVFVPTNMQVVARERDVLDLGERFAPVDDLRLLGPEILVVVDRSFIELEILCFADQPVLFEIVVDGVGIAHRILRSVGTLVPGQLPVTNIFRPIWRVRIRHSSISSS